VPKESERFDETLGEVLIGKYLQDEDGSDG
jgi:hypothetical protein